ncbi:hypothetical protein ALQ68_03856 [Pseudomonas savastanoi pv. glycinea]|nr:hypothetical protein ALQ68_03856 [Pseudomonas savastanoi pv. glycinea]
MAAGGEQLRRPAPCQTGTYRHTVAQTLGQGHDVRHDALVLKGKPLAGPPHAGLDFVEHQQPVTPRAALPQRLEIPGWRDLRAAFALNRLHQYCGNAVPVSHADLVERRQIAKGYFEVIPRQGAEAQAHSRSVTGRQCAQRAAVKGVFHDHHQRPFDVLVPAVQARQLQRSLVGLGTGVIEKHPIQPRQTGQFLRQTLLPVNAVKIGSVQQQTRLIPNGLYQQRMRMADIGHRHARHSIQVLAPALVPQMRAQASGEAQGQRLVSAHQAGSGHDVKLLGYVSVFAVSLTTPYG